MTKNQIEYGKLLETSRNNQVIEDLTRKRDRANLELGRGTLAESVRHNKATESQAVAMLGETSRSNRAKEELQAQAQSEAARHNVASETLQHGQLAETRRSNVAREVETQRANLARESETTRSNLAREAETTRSNLARESETNRSNLANEAIGRQRNAIASQQVSLGYSQLAEQQRHSMVVENETRRSNMAAEAEAINKRTQTLKEQSRHNQVMERQGEAQVIELNRHNLATEQLTSERQDVQEYVDRRNATSNRQRALGDLISSAARSVATAVALGG